MKLISYTAIDFTSHKWRLSQLQLINIDSVWVGLVGCLGMKWTQYNNYLLPCGHVPTTSNEWTSWPTSISHILSVLWQIDKQKVKINNFPTSSALKQLLTTSLSPVIWKPIMPCKATCCEKIDLWSVAFILGTLGLVRADAKVQGASWNYLRNVWELFTSHHSIPFQSLYMYEQTGNKTRIFFWVWAFILLSCISVAAFSLRLVASGLVCKASFNSFSHHPLSLMNTGVPRTCWIWLWVILQIAVLKCSSLQQK